jgi:peptide/nickel transport system permease protein
LLSYCEFPATEDRSRRYQVRFLVDGAEYEVAGIWSSRTHLFGVDEPARIFLLGTDGYGRDLFSRLLRGGQISLLAGLLATALSVGEGLVLGSAAGLNGRWADESIMRLADIFLALPWLYLLLAVRAFLPLNIGAVEAFFLVVVVIGVTGWARPARLVRGVVLSAKERNYVLAARGFGASNFYLFRRHILPHTTGIVLTQATILVPQYSLSEITLSFLGLGVGEPVPSWGNMLASLQQYHVLASYWWMFLPAVPVILVFWAYYTLANTLQEQITQ